MDRRAYVEILEVLKYVIVEELEKIPKEELEFFEKNKDTTYEFKFDESKNIIEQDLLSGTIELFFDLYNKYVK